MKRALVAVLALVVLLPLAAALAAVLGGQALLNTGLVRGRLADAVARATGHPLRIDGPIRLSWSLTPEIEARDVALLNPPGFSRPAFATAAGITARVALLPLASGQVRVRSIRLDRPDVRLERDAAGRGNWMPPAATAPPAATPATPRHPTAAVEIAKVTITGGQVEWRGVAPVQIPSLDLSPAGGPVHGTLLFGVPVALDGQTGPLSQTPFRFKLSAVGGGLALTAASEGDEVGVEVLMPDAAALSPVLAPVLNRPVPPVRDVRLSARLGPAGLASARLTAGASDLGALWPGLSLTRLDLSSPAPDQPVTLVAEGRLRDLAVSAAANAASPAALTGPDPAAVQALVLADGGKLSGQGTVTGWGARGFDVSVSARAPDLRRTGALAGVSLPGIGPASLDARLQTGPGGAGVLARGLRLAAPQGDLAGDLAFGSVPRPFVRGSLVSQRLDLDALGAALPPAAAPAPPRPASPPPGPAAAPGPLLPDHPLPFAALRQVDADVRAAVADATLYGASYRAVETRVLLQDGKLRVDPAQARTPGGLVQGTLAADAAAVPPTAALTLRAPGLDATPIAAAAGAPGAITGTLDLDVQLRGAGATTRAMAATVQGHAGAALAQGTVENQALIGAVGDALRAANLPIEAGGRSQVRCLALTADAEAGQLLVRSLVLDTTRLRLQGEGTVNLVDETLNLHLRPTITIGGVGVGGPVRLTGPLRSPSAALERGGGAPAQLGIDPGRLGVDLGRLGINPGRFGIAIGPPAGDPCGPALAAVRAGLAQATPR